MTSIRDLRAGKPMPYPDQALYLESACAHHGVPFAALDGDGGTLVRIGEGPRGCVIATTGRTCVYPPNSASAMAIATDKHFTGLALDAQGVANLGGEAFFLNARMKNLRRPGHEIEDARTLMQARGYTAFCKPLAGSRGDFAERISSNEGFEDWLARVGRMHDAILIQDVFEGEEYRVFLVDGEVIFVMQRFAAVLRGDGVRSLGALHEVLAARQIAAGLSPSALPASRDASTVLSSGETVTLDDRRNASAGASVRLVDDAPPDVLRLARAAREAVGLRVAGVDVMVTSDATRIIEINGNPAIFSLEALGREDVILRLWGEVFTRMGLIDHV
ncbi:MAG: hypothetical protein JWM36_3666 [Hyphomicrobiales bacterium]|nr:hypothetical protein [Hyphomicrobiales bacterium]